MTNRGIAATGDREARGGDAGKEEDNAEGRGEEIEEKEEGDRGARL
jgi:hypothetical protein